VVSLAGAIGAMLAGMLVQAAPALAKASEIGFNAEAYGTQVLVGTTVQSGRSAASSLACTSTVGVEHTNSAASVGVPIVLSTGTIDTSAASESNATGVDSTGTSTIQNVSLLNGLVGATAVDSVSTTSRDTATKALSTSSAGTQFVGLNVLGLPITGTPAPNTKITLPGVGYVELNQQTSHVNQKAGKAGLKVIAIHVDVTLSTPLAPVGTQIFVGYASSGLGGPVVGLLDGLAFGASANVANTILAGEAFPEALACFGTEGVTKTNSGAAVSLPGIATSGTVTDTAEGVAGHKNAMVHMTSTIEGLNLLSSILTATAISADVSASGNAPTLTDNSSFLGLTVAGFPAIGDNVAPNTKLSLAGLGTLYLHRVFKEANKITVIMVELVVTVPSNPLGLALGTTVKVGFARAGIH
jgi:hypothetical protein